MKKKMFYLLAVLLVFSLAITGCSSGGGVSLPGDNTDDDQKPSAETVSINGEFNFPESGDVTSSSVNSLSNDNYELVVENFDTGKILKDIEITFIESNKYKVSGIETGLNIVVNIIRTNDELKISTFIPEISKDDEEDETVGNTDSATTVLTAIVKKQKEKSGSIEMTRDEVRERKAEIEEVVKDIKAEHLKGIVEDVEQDRIEPTDDITKTITNVKEKIEEGQVKENAEKMVDFVRQSGILIRNSAATHDAIIKNNLDTLGPGMDNFINEFETEMSHLFTSKYINKLPTNYVSKESYTLSDLDTAEEQFPEKLFQLEEWKWIIKSDNDVITITTDFPATVDTGDNPEYVDLSKASFNYTINNSDSNKYFEGTFNITSDATELIPVYDVDGVKLFDMEAPVDGEMVIDGEYRFPSYEKDDLEKLSLTYDNNNILENGTEIQDVTITGYINIPDVFEFDGEISYDAEVEYDSNHIIQNINYIDVMASGLFDFQKYGQNNMKIFAENIHFEIDGPDGVLKEIFLEGELFDENKQVIWSGQLDIGFVTFNDNYGDTETEVKGFQFMGSVNNKESEELILNINPLFNYDEEGELLSGESAVRLEQGSKYLAGKIIAESNKTKVILENENHSKFFLEESDQGIIADNSYILNASGDKIADINSDGIIYYMDDENGGRIGSLY